MFRYSHAAWNSAAALLWDNQEKRWVIYDNAKRAHEPLEPGTNFDAGLAVLRTYKAAA